MGLPTAGQVMQILDDIDATRAHCGAVYVHCWGGVGRTGTLVIGCWLLATGVDGAGDVARIAGAALRNRIRASVARGPRPRSHWYAVGGGDGEVPPAAPPL